MRVREPDIRRRVKDSVELRFMSTGLTSYAGLEVVRRYFHSLGLPQRLGRHLGGRLPAIEFGIVPMILVVRGILRSRG